MAQTLSQASAIQLLDKGVLFQWRAMVKGICIYMGHLFSHVCVHLLTVRDEPEPCWSCPVLLSNWLNMARRVSQASAMS